MSKEESISFFRKFQEIPHISSEIIVYGELLDQNFPGFLITMKETGKKETYYDYVCRKTQTLTFKYEPGNPGKIQNFLFYFNGQNSLKMSKSRIVFGLASLLGIDCTKYSYEELFAEIEKRKEELKNVNSAEELKEKFPKIYEINYQDVLRINK